MLKQLNLYILLCLFLLPAISTKAKSEYSTRAFDKNIRSIQIQNLQRSPYLPIIELNGSDNITLSFDDLSGDLYTYYYKIIHCNADWTKSLLSESQYIEGYTGGYLDYESSMNTYFPYYHYSLEFPNDDANCTVSGNYVILIFRDNDTDNPVLTACFSVVENLVELDCSVSGATDIDYQKSHQQVSVTINYPEYDINQAENTLKVIVQQNRRRDNQAVLTAPSFYQRNSVNYKLNKKLIFDAGSPYYSFDVSSVRILDRRVKDITYYRPYYHVTLFTDRMNAGKSYQYSEDVNGRYVVNVQGSSDPDVDGDYFFTHFSLETDDPYLAANIYIMGDLTNNRMDETSRMTYNFETKCYEKTLLLKQGGYNYTYAYALIGDTVGNTGVIVGNYWQTKNEYLIYVYHHPFGSLYDKLIGYTVVYPNSNF